jgi:hypothetical protein
MNTQEDLEMIRKPSSWPAYPCLPLRRSKKPDVGLLVDTQGPIVFLANIFGLAHGDENLEDAEKLEYGTFQAILDDGWYID